MSDPVNSPVAEEVANGPPPEESERPVTETVQTSLKPVSTEKEPAVPPITPAGSDAQIQQTQKTSVAVTQPTVPAARPKRSYVATPEVKRAIYLTLSGLAFLFVVLMIFTDGLYNPIHLSLPLFIAGYGIFYQFFPHDWEKERYWMSHLHLGSTLIVGLLFVSPWDVSKEHLCSDGNWGRIIDINSMAYFIIDSLVLIDTLWITHHSLSIGCAIFGIAGTRQTVGGSVYVWYAEIGGLLYHISRMWADSKTVRQIFLVCYLTSRLFMLWIASISFRCTYDQFNRAGFGADLLVDATLTCFTTGVALVNLKFLYTNYINYVKRFGSKKKPD